MTRHLTYLSVFILCTAFSLTAAGQEKKETADRERRIYLKIDQGMASGTLLDQKMSHLHYAGPGFMVQFGRSAETERYLSELTVLRFSMHYMKPAHQATRVTRPSAGIRYQYLRRLGEAYGTEIFAGAQASIYADLRYAPSLGNSYLYGDGLAEIRPHGKISTRFYLFRDWNVDISLNPTFAGYGLRAPRYGTVYRIGDDGKAAFQGFEKQFLHPFNYRHITTGIYLRESFGGVNNPNRFRIGYLWDYYAMQGEHGLKVYSAVHQWVLELYFRVN